MPRINIELPVYFTCQSGCSNCCNVNGGYVLIDNHDITRIAGYLKVSKNEFLTKYTYQKDDKLCLLDHDDEACIFLENHKCTIYPVRPIQCRTFPFWPQNLKSEKRWKQVQEECPGIGVGQIFRREDIDQIFEGKSVDSEK